MRLDVYAANVSPSQALVSFAQERFESAMRRFQGRIDHVTVRVSDQNGPTKGGIDMRCTAEIRTTRAGSVIIDAHANDAYAAVGRAAKTLKRTLSRHFEKHTAPLTRRLRRQLRDRERSA